MQIETYPQQHGIGLLIAELLGGNIGAAAQVAKVHGKPRPRIANLPVPLAVGVVETQAYRSPLRAVDTRAGLEQVEVAGSEPLTNPEFALGVPRDEVNGTAGGIAAEERPLGTPQYFNTLEVSVVREYTGTTLDVDTILIDGHPAVRPQGRTGSVQAANLEQHALGSSGTFHRREIGYQGIQIQQIIDAIGFYAVAAECRYGDRHILQALLAALCRDDHLFQGCGASLGQGDTG